MKRLSKLKKASKRAIPKKRVVKKAAVKKASLTRRAVIKKKRNLISKKRFVVNKNALIKNAEYLHDHVLLVSFSDGHKQEVDFSGFLNDGSTPAYMKKYKSEVKFKRFRVEGGNLVWGKDWDLIFPIDQLYAGRIH